MTAELIEFLLGLYFLGVSIPHLFDTPRSNPVIVQFIFGAVLFALALFHISLIALRG